MKTFIFSLIAIVLLGCTNSKNHGEDDQVGYDSESKYEEYEENYSPDEENIQLNPIDIQQMLSIYSGWNRFLTYFHQMGVQSATQNIQMAQSIMQTNMQQMQETGLQDNPVNQQINSGLQQQIQQSQLFLQNSQYGYQLANNNTQLISLSAEPQNINLLSQIRALHAVGMYQIFGKGGNQSYEQCVHAALRWMLSPQYEADIKNGIAYMAAQNRINRANAASTQSPLSILSADRHQQKFSDILLNQKTWVDPANGDQYKMDINIENPKINGQDMNEY